MDIQTAIQSLAKYIHAVPEHFRELSTEVLLQKPQPNKWSKQEILGHLIDSAINNLKRFTEAQFAAQPYQVIRYNQDELAMINKYQQLPLDHLLLLWQSLNRQIHFVLEEMPAKKLSYAIVTPAGESKTLEWLAVDYVVHMEHHLKQVFGEEA